MISQAVVVRGWRGRHLGVRLTRLRGAGYVYRLCFCPHETQRSLTPLLPIAEQPVTYAVVSVNDSGAGQTRIWLIASIPTSCACVALTARFDVPCRAFLHVRICSTYTSLGLSGTRGCSVEFYVHFGIDKTSSRSKT